jgi:hypothetical protein
MRLRICVAVFLAGACGPERVEVYRGAGTEVAALPVAERVAVYRAALGGSFTLNDATLSILVDPVLLPRDAGLAGGDTMPRELITALRNSQLVQGTCTVPVKNIRSPLICRAERDGYAVRFSDPFALGPDSVQVHLVVQQYVTPNGRPAEKLRFERAYHIARRSGAWRAVREARLPQP